MGIKVIWQLSEKEISMDIEPKTWRWGVKWDWPCVEESTLVAVNHRHEANKFNDEKRHWH